MEKFMCGVKWVVARAEEEKRERLAYLGDPGSYIYRDGWMVECRLGWHKLQNDNIFAALRSVDNNARPAPSVITARNCRWVR